MNAEIKTCPDCAEDVKAAARVCRFCGYRFDGNDLPPVAEDRSDEMLGPDDLPSVVESGDSLRTSRELDASDSVGKVSEAHGFVLDPFLKRIAEANDGLMSGTFFPPGTEGRAVKLRRVQLMMKISTLESILANQKPDEDLIGVSVFMMCSQAAERQVTQLSQALCDARLPGAVELKRNRGIEKIQKHALKRRSESASDRVYQDARLYSVAETLDANTTATRAVEESLGALPFPEYEDGAGVRQPIGQIKDFVAFVATSAEKWLRRAEDEVAQPSPSQDPSIIREFAMDASCDEIEAGVRRIMLEIELQVAKTAEPNLTQRARDAGKNAVEADRQAREGDA